jgi:aspartokinase-like uncharacterized kinase
VRVVKLGGSLADWAELPACLTDLANRNCVIVPGGGPFAEQVRDAQHRWRFDDQTAHDMALLAMAQFGRMLTGLEPRLATATTGPDLRSAVTRGRSVVWLPEPAAAELRTLPASWDITSDTLAAWLASSLGATELVLVKSAAVPPGESDLARLSAAGLLDRAFATFAADGACASWICHREHYRRLLDPLRDGPGLWRVGPTARN